MHIIETNISGAYLIEGEPHRDERGSFCRLYCKQEYQQAGIDFDPVQMNISTNLKAGTLRGMHYKLGEYGEQKVVRVVKGSVLDVIVDVRPNSPTYLMNVSVELTAENMTSLYVPKGCAHGFLTLKDDTDVLYQMGCFHEAGNEAGLRWDDPALSIKWPHPPLFINERDASYPLLDVSK